MKWSDKAWQEIAPVYQSILGMPFIQELMDGSLDPGKFRFYIMQDSAYLDHFGRALALIAARAHGTEAALAFIRFAEGAIVVERALHQVYFSEYAVTGDVTIEPACHHYTHYLKSTAAFDQVETAMAAVLPCFWIYKKVGDHIYRHHRATDNPFRQWIDTYAGEAFGKLVEQAINLCDEAASACTSGQQASMTRAFVTASRLEWMFWDSAYRLHRW
jgi:thiaminase/transcriptional activator TenA